jgi:membrane protein DedA with SNARE-associated domain
MSRLIDLCRRFALLRLLADVAFIPVWAILVFVCINSFGAYTHFGDLGAMVAIVLFVGWAWWWSERRDRREAESEHLHAGHH